MQLRTKQRLDAIVGGLGIAVLRPFAGTLGAVLRRDHSAAPKGEIAVLKLLGGGSLVLAAPSLLGVRRRYPDARMILVTTAGVIPFGRALGLFDDYVVLEDRSVLTLATSGLRAIARLTQVDTVVDLEPYSRLSSVLATLSLARNRFSFFLESAYWREGLATHLVFLNRASRIGIFYESVAGALDARPAQRTELAGHVASAIGAAVSDNQVDGRVTQCNQPGRLCIAPTCSDFGPERMLSPGQWLRVLKACLPPGTREIVVLGGPNDHETAEAVIEVARPELSGCEWLNACDGRPLASSLQLLAGSGHFIGIDSGLLHFARLFGIPARSFWGPTDPSTRLDSPVSIWDRAHYARTACSPCIHVAETPPCWGRNLCMEAAVLDAVDPGAARAFAATVLVPVFSRFRNTTS
jgi:ADP-heptose:LPS heptosyltransferase